MVVQDLLEIKTIYISATNYFRVRLRNFAHIENYICPIVLCKVAQVQSDWRGRV